MFTSEEPMPNRVRFHPLAPLNPWTCTNEGLPRRVLTPEWNVAEGSARDLAHRAHTRHTVSSAPGKAGFTDAGSACFVVKDDGPSAYPPGNDLS